MVAHGYACKLFFPRRGVVAKVVGGWLSRLIYELLVVGAWIVPKPEPWSGGSMLAVGSVAGRAARAHKYQSCNVRRVAMIVLALVTVKMTINRPYFWVIH